MLAADHGWVEVMEKLVIAGAEVEAGDEEGRRALHYAFDGPSEPALLFLIQQGCDINVSDIEGQTPPRAGG